MHGYRDDMLAYVPIGHFLFCRTSAEVLIGTVPIHSDNAIHYPFCRTSVSVPIRTERIMPRGFSMPAFYPRKQLYVTSHISRRGIVLGPVSVSVSVSAL